MKDYSKLGHSACFENFDALGLINEIYIVDPISNLPKNKPIVTKDKPVAQDLSNINQAVVKDNKNDNITKVDQSIETVNDTSIEVKIEIRHK